jgi:sugar/nucleoside kinase (ribokinase family)
MPDTRYDVLGIGNAIVDIIARCDDPFIRRHGLDKGHMHLVDAERSGQIYADMGQAIETSGGSAANTIAGVASLGGRGAYFGKIADDAFGKVFRHDIQSLGIDFESRPVAPGGPPTATSLILVTPDGERTMNTHLGACVLLDEADVDEAKVKAARITYLEGYLFDRPAAKRAFRLAAKYAHAAGRKVALTLSDAFCVDRHRSEFLELIRGSVDIVFANTAEVASLYQTSDFGAACQKLAADAPLAAVTRGAAGSLIVRGPERIDVAPEPVAAVVDATGAGDLYAAGFLIGQARAAPLALCGRLASLAAADAISHIGPRPEARLADLAAAQGITLTAWHDR